MTINSADSHVVEPLDLWQTRLPPELRERAPRREEVDGRWVFVVEGVPPRKMGGPDAEGASGMRPGGFDPDVRVKDLDADGVWGEVLYPTIGLFAFMIPDSDLRIECARAYNSWLAETFAATSTRFAGAAIIPVQDVDVAVAEIERVSSIGLRSVMLPMQAPADRPYNRTDYDPLWAAAAAHAMPVSFHVGTGSNPVTERGPGRRGHQLRRGRTRRAAHAGLPRGVGRARTPSRPPRRDGRVRRGWLAWAIERMDEAFEEHHWWVDPKLKETPGEYVRRQAHVTFGADVLGDPEPRDHRRRRAAVGVGLPAPGGHVAPHARRSTVCSSTST